MNAEVYKKQNEYFYHIKRQASIIASIPGMIISHLVLAPFFVTSIQKQLSVDPHKDIYSDTSTKKIERISFKEKMKQFLKEPSSIRRLMYNSNKDSFNDLNQQTNKLTELNKSLENIKKENSLKPFIVTNRERINNELIKASGVPENQKPYRAPIYDNYLQMLKSYNKQGILSFWKGTGYRILFQIGPLIFLNPLVYRLNSKTEYFSEYTLYNQILELVSFSILESFLHPLYVIENRYVLQNRLPHFRTYQSGLSMFIRSVADLYTCSLGHLFKNVALLTGALIANFTQNIFNINNDFISQFCGLTLSYPITTALRRMTCQSTQYAGMLPPRYLNLLHAFFLIKREEGLFKGLYKGYLPFIVGSFLFSKLLKFLIENLNLKSRLDTLENDEYFNQLIINKSLIN